MGYYIQPKIDSPVIKATKTGLQALFTFMVGLAVTVWSVPGVPDAVTKFANNNLPTVFLSVGLPLVVGSGLTSFLYNLWLTKK